MISWCVMVVSPFELLEQRKAPGLSCRGAVENEKRGLLMEVFRLGYRMGSDTTYPLDILYQFDIVKTVDVGKK